MAHPLPDFARRQWVSPEARSLWEPRLQRIAQVWEAAERRSVADGIREAALQRVTPEQLPELTQRAAARGLVVTPLGIQGRADGYAASAVPKNGGPWDYRVAITTLAAASLFTGAWKSGDDETIGQLLGYPECCRRFFDATWDAGSVDPTWEMSDRSEGPVVANVLLRWLGVRYVPHMPCSFGCRESESLGTKLRLLIPEVERGWIDELLSMPMLWSSLYGIGEVVTPIVSVNFRSDVAYELREIRHNGAYPEAAAYGLRFPYRIQPKKLDDRLWQDNGFSSLEAMEKAHEIIEAAAPGEHPRWVCDLGCGNGMLARKLAGSKGHAIGIECDPTKVERAERYLDEAITADLHDTAALDYPHDLVVLMPGRLLERESRAVRQLRGHHLLVYAYGDWLTTYGSLEKLCRRAGLDGHLEGEQIGDGVAAGLWRWR